ncbi:UNVERIFIED_CONTAM: hypothetical protein Sangu_1596100 [Sesamum angustifolium]|uniref:Bifunctional lysine-specific demethylase and histidyl-hydroxylase n=1 Tax=Sesamum angustifolium TaxID=2727405 RepID=A0AAW2MSU0_9LAMI
METTTTTKKRRRQHETTLFPLLLAALCSNCHNRRALIKKCLNRVLLSLPHLDLSPILSLLPALLKFNLEIIGAASLASIVMNEKIAEEGEIMKGLISLLGSSKRGTAMAACNALLDISTTCNGRQRLVEFSAIENLLWEGLMQVALYCWDKKQKVLPYKSDDSVPWSLHLLSVKLLHIAIKLIGNHDPGFQKACLVGAIHSKDCLFNNQMMIFRDLISRITSDSKFSDAVEHLEAAIHKNEDPLEHVRWMKHLNEEGEEVERSQSLSISSADSRCLPDLLIPHNRDTAKAAFVHIKSKFCREVEFQDAEQYYKMLLEKYRKVRKQYSNGMLSLHSALHDEHEIISS